MQLRSIFLFVALTPNSATADPVAARIEFFEKSVRPILVEECQRCHGDEKQRGGLRLDSREWMLRGGDNGPSLVPGHPEKSRLVDAVRHLGETKMPPKKKLAERQIAALSKWIRDGATWPDGSTTPRPRSVAEVRAGHWAFRPVVRPVLPRSRNSPWVRNPVDAFILARLELRGIAPSDPAPARTLIRRMTLDMWGLPPTPQQVDTFDSAFSVDPDRAVSDLVERLLASPRYGERWGRHWLDVARYADTKGYVFTKERRFPFSYTYRDYVIRSLNEDLPYDRFVVEQLAADRLDLGEDNRALAAMGFLTLGRRFLENTHDIIDDRIDVTMRGLQGLTVNCARCHDHKFDPIPTKDYYSLYGVFASSVEPKELPLLTGSEDSPGRRRFDEELAKRQRAATEYREKYAKELAARNRKFRDGLRRLEKRVQQWKVESPDSPPRATVLEDRRRPFEPRVFIRGNSNRQGDPVPRRFLEVLSTDDRPPFRSGSGRLELANAIASSDNPLTARVLANRVWGWHFGRPLVDTPSDFGLRSDPPTHPLLLDWLAAEFMDKGWSLKHLHRLILRSSTYCQSTRSRPENAGNDPENRLLARMNRRRLEFEPLRDSLLFVAGSLEPTMGGKPIDILKRPFRTSRTVYGYIDRQNLPGLLRTFDFASPDSSSPGRYVTTVPQQALFLMNSPFVTEQAKAFASRPEVASSATNTEKIRTMYRLAFGREPTPRELSLGEKYLTAERPKPGLGDLFRDRMSPLEQYARVLLVSNEFAFAD